MKWKIWAPIAVVAVLLVVFFAARTKETAITTPTGDNQTGAPATVRTGDVDLDAVLNTLVDAGVSGDDNLNSAPSVEFDTALDDLNTISI